MNNIDTKELERLLNEQKKARKSGRFSKFIVLWVILLNVLFTAFVFKVFIETGGSEPSTLIVSWFGFTTVELWSLSKIKREESK